jgi:diguanylate cyclase (GGDEF)-like protein
MSSDWRSEDKILFIGGVDEHISGEFAKNNIRHVSNILDGIELACENGYKAIIISLQLAGARSQQVLSSLREVKKNAKIILLAQMFEEPLARELMNPNGTGQPLVDDYIVCPASAADILALVEEREERAVSKEPSLVIEALEKLATTDELTKLKNRRYTLEFARQAIELAKSEHRQVTLLLFDIDNFKHYNDLYGHPAGDEILKQTAKLIHASCRPHDIVGRIGGDEFAVIFWNPDTKTMDDASGQKRRHLGEHPREPIFIIKRFQQLIRQLELPCLGPEQKGILSISGGLATFPDDGANITELTKSADDALLEAKKSGKNKVYIVGLPDKDISSIY